MLIYFTMNTHIVAPPIGINSMYVMLLGGIYNLFTDAIEKECQRNEITSQIFSFQDLLLSKEASCIGATKKC